jgi:hypothetical protein
LDEIKSPPMRRSHPLVVTDAETDNTQHTQGIADVRQRVVTEHAFRPPECAQRTYADLVAAELIEPDPEPDNAKRTQYIAYKTTYSATKL